MIPYSLNAAIILTGCLLFYKLLLQKETFYRLNRFVLLMCLVFSFTLPLLPVPVQYSFRDAATPAAEQLVVPVRADERLLPGEQINPLIKNEGTPTIPAKEKEAFGWPATATLLLAL